MIKVFNPSAFIDVHYDWFENNKYFQPSTDIEEVVAQPIKIACLPVFFNIAKTNNLRQPIPNDIVDQFDLILLSDIEYFTMAEISQWITKSNIKNYCLAIGSLKVITNIDNVIYRPWWAFNLMNKNTYVDTSKPNKSFLFDALLGRAKPHRSLVMNRFIESDLLTNSIVTYRKSVFDNYTDNSKDYVSPNLDPSWEVQDNVDYAVSDQMPWKIYEQTYYSVITETLGADTFFWSEKTTKPLLSQRVFVHIGSAGFLRNLHAFGFKTFDSVIDESYDLIVNNKDRWNRAFDQIELLSKLDPQEVLTKTADIRLHNYNRLHEFRKEIKTQMLGMVYNKIKEIR
jgi:hypothetical protein